MCFFDHYTCACGLCILALRGQKLVERLGWYEGSWPVANFIAKGAKGFAILYTSASKEAAVQSLCSCKYSMRTSR